MQLAACTRTYDSGCEKIDLIEINCRYFDSIPPISGTFPGCWSICETVMARPSGRLRIRGGVGCRELLQRYLQTGWRDSNFYGNKFKLMRNCLEFVLNISMSSAQYGGCSWWRELIEKGTWDDTSHIY